MLYRIHKLHFVTHAFVLQVFCKEAEALLPVLRIFCLTHLQQVTFTVVPSLPAAAAPPLSPHPQKGIVLWDVPKQVKWWEIHQDQTV